VYRQITKETFSTPHQTLSSSRLRIPQLRPISHIVNSDLPATKDV